MFGEGIVEFGTDADSAELLPCRVERDEVVNTGSCGVFELGDSGGAIGSSDDAPSAPRASKGPGRGEFCTPPKEGRPATTAEWPSWFDGCGDGGLLDCGGACDGIWMWKPFADGRLRGVPGRPEGDEGGGVSML